MPAEPEGAGLPRRRTGAGPTAPAQALSSAGIAEAAIRRFLETSRDPVLVEPGEPPLELRPGSFLLEWRSGRLMLEVWDDTHNLTRRIQAIHREGPGRLELAIERFGKRQGRLLLADRARSEPGSLERRSRRWMLRERLRRALERQWPGWRVAELSAEANLEHSLSPVYPRALLRRGGEAWAAILSPREPGVPAWALSFGLVWLEYLRRREKRLAVHGLVLILPDGEEAPTCWRLAWLDPEAGRFLVYVYSDQGEEEPVDPGEYANLDTSLEDRHVPRGRAPEAEAWVERLARQPAVEVIEHKDGDLSLRVRGLEFARLSGSGLWFGLEERRRAESRHVEEIERLAQELARLRNPEAPASDNPIQRLHPERWLESQVRRQLDRIDPTLLPHPIYGQVPAVAGGDRSVIDLLAVDSTGRLAVLELKATEDIHLPLQALDYWMRVCWHLERGDFTARGYFPGIVLRPVPPRLLLIAPALAFHPTTEAILRYFRREVEVERIGLGVEWRRELEVVFRARGAARPED